MLASRRLFLLLPIALAATACESGTESTPSSTAPEIRADRKSDGVPSGFTVGTRLVASGLVSPVHLTTPDDDSERLFVVDQVGDIRVVTSEGELLPTPFLSVRDRLVALRPGYDERGLLGLAFHPDYEDNGRFFVYYSAPARPGAPMGTDHTSHISEFRVSADPDRADPSSERIILQVDQPQRNHNGGSLAFGPDDDMLYIALGDGGGARDVGAGHVEDWYERNAGGNGQDVEQNLLGSILRIDVDGGWPYAIPRDNPFVGKTGMDEIWAYGFRNPYRMSFDMSGQHGSGHDLLVGDAGQARWEEVSLVTRGGNYGWNVKEGAHCFDAANPNQDLASCPDRDPVTGAQLIDPVIEYLNSNQPGGLGRVVVAGYVYRGDDLPQLEGRYIFGDFSRMIFPADGTLFVATPRRSGMWHMQEMRIHQSPDGRLGSYIKGFGQDQEGEVYVLVTNNLGPTGMSGRVLRLVRPGERD